MYPGIIYRFKEELSKARSREASYADNATVQPSRMKIYRLDGGNNTKKQTKQAKNKNKKYSLNKCLLSTYYMPS